MKKGLNKTERRLIKKIRRKKYYGKYRGRFNPTTIKEALSRVYFVHPVKNNHGDYSGGHINTPKCLNGMKVKLIIEKLKKGAKEE